MTEIVYIVTNESIPGYCKIGKTKNINNRIKSLDCSSTPLPFQCHYAARVANADQVEKYLHDAFADRRVRPNREWFELDPSRAEAALRIGALQDVTPSADVVETQTDQEALDKAREQRSRFNFKMVEIPTGAVLHSTIDPVQTATVVNDRTIEFRDRVTSLTSAALEILAENGRSYKAVQGPLYWSFDDETLVERRMRLEAM